MYNDVSLKLRVGTCIMVTFSRVEGTTVSVDGVISAARGRNLAPSVMLSPESTGKIKANTKQ
jgi:hypothetical protein